MGRKVSVDKLKFLFVVWEDAAADVGWKTFKKEDFEENLVISSGWFLEENKDFLVLAADLDKNLDHSNRRMEIPKSCIKYKSEFKDWVNYVDKVQKKRRRSRVPS